MASDAGVAFRRVMPLAEVLTVAVAAAAAGWLALRIVERSLTAATDAAVRLQFGDADVRVVAPDVESDVTGGGAQVGGGDWTDGLLPPLPETEVAGWTVPESLGPDYVGENL